MSAHRSSAAAPVFVGSSDQDMAASSASNATDRSWCFSLNTEQAWDALYEACEKAQSSIDFEQFIFLNDDTGNRFTDLFVKKAAEGVRVRLLCDTIGSYFFYLSYLPDSLRSFGIEILFFNQIKPWRPLRFNTWFSRDHRKLFIVDGKTAFLGGTLIGDCYRSWRDTQVRLSGPVVSQLQETFDHMWWLASHERFIRFKSPRQAKDGFTVLTNSPHLRQRFINPVMLDVIRGAKHSICITTPYFVPDARFFRVLRLAASRGVKVQVLLPKISDYPMVDAASSHYFERLFKVGGRIFRYPEMIHAKTIVVDGNWASVGSANIDNLSSFFNYEILVTTHDQKFVDEVKKHFLNDLEKAQEVSASNWSKRPLMQKFREFISIPFASFF